MPQPLRFATCALLTCCALPTSAQELTQPSVLVSATRVDMLDTDAPYASEVHTLQDIQRSGAHNLFDYLAQHSSLQVAPSYGNRYAPSISTRGFGENGQQNLVITVNGRRLNNIDSIPQLIGAVPLADIERIEITKGIGGVMFGDGATAGTIQIYTKAGNSNSVDLYAGNQGQRGATVTAGLQQERWDLSVTADHSHSDGFSAADALGHTDSSKTNTLRASATVRASQDLRLDVEAGRSHVDMRYPNALTPAQFVQDPGMNTEHYRGEKLSTDHWSLGAHYQLAPAWQLTAKYHHIDKTSQYTGSLPAHYSTHAPEVALQYQQGAWLVNAGVQAERSQRSNPSGRTAKDNTGAFLQTQYLLEATTLSAGLRKEQVKYEHQGTGQAALRQTDRLSAWELGINHRLSPPLSLFASYSRAFVSPDIDSFFTFSDPYNYHSPLVFNTFIQPATTRTLTAGLNHETPAHKLKLSAFYTRLHNEIYYSPFTWTNTNLDRTHKYGLELQSHWTLHPRLALHTTYGWTRAKIDREDSGGTDLRGQHIPGVPTHNLTLGLDWSINARTKLYVSHSWRSSTWAYGNFSNNPAYRQSAYRATDVALRHQWNTKLELYASVSNLFAQRNSVAVSGQDYYALYPSNFERSWKLGARWTF